MTIIMYNVKHGLGLGGAIVKVTREQAAANRERILEVAGTLVRERGFDRSGVADIMKEAGLTHGGFYGHFESKDDLVAQSIAGVLTREGWLGRLTGKAKPSFADVVRAYLSPRHRDHRGAGCMFAALGSDVVHQARRVRHAFTEGFRARVEALRAVMPGRPQDTKRDAMAAMAALVGGLMLARAVDDPGLSDEILDVVSDALLASNRWRR